MATESSSSLDAKGLPGLLLRDSPTAPYGADRFSPAARLLLVLLALAAGCRGVDPAAIQSPPVEPDTAKLPLTDAPAEWKYLGRFEGGLYPNGNAPSAAHMEAGRARAAAITPRNAIGAPSEGGKYVLLSIGMSNTTQEFCSQGALPPCDPWTFMGMAAADTAVNHSSLALVNGARGGQDASAWVSAAGAEYDRIRDRILSPEGLSERQVQAVWLKIANARPSVSLPAENADAHQLVRQIGEIGRALKQRYPDLQMVFLSSRIYGGYATGALNPEPFAYESGLAVKWAIEAQIEQMATGAMDSRAGDLRIDSAAPWLGWGPYLWARGSEPRGDGLFWLPQDFQSDGTHPSRSGEEKVGRMLLDFFKSSPLASCWFLNGQRC